MKLNREQESKEIPLQPGWHWQINHALNGPSDRSGAVIKAFEDFFRILPTEDGQEIKREFPAIMAQAAAISRELRQVTFSGLEESIQVLANHSKSEKPSILSQLCQQINKLPLEDKKTLLSSLVETAHRFSPFISNETTAPHQPVTSSKIQDRFKLAFPNQLSPLPQLVTDNGLVFPNQQTAEKYEKNRSNFKSITESNKVAVVLACVIVGGLGGGYSIYSSAEGAGTLNGITIGLAVIINTWEYLGPRIAFDMFKKGPSSGAAAMTKLGSVLLTIAGAYGYDLYTNFNGAPKLGITALIPQLLATFISSIGPEMCIDPLFETIGKWKSEKE